MYHCVTFNRYDDLSPRIVAERFSQAKQRKEESFLNKIMAFIGLAIIGFLVYRYRYFLLRYKITRRLLIRSIMAIPPLRRRMLKKYSPFAV